MDEKNEKNENDQLLQKFEKDLIIQQVSFEDIQVEIPLKNPFKANEEKFKLIRPMYDLVVSQMNLIRTCFYVHTHIAFVEENGSSTEITFSQQLSDIVFESVSIRNNLIEIIGAMEQLSKGIAKFIKIANNEKVQDKPLVKFLHFVETPRERLKTLLDKKHELDTQKVSTLKKNLIDFMNVSGSKAIPEVITKQAQCKIALEALENERQRIFIEDITEYDEVAKIISKIEFFQTKLSGHEHLKQDLQKEKKMLQDHRDVLEKQALTSATSSRIVKMFLFMRNNDLDVLRKKKKFVKQDISEITNQENQKILLEAKCKKELKSLSEKLNTAKEKVERAEIAKKTRLSDLDERIETKKKEVENFEEKILQILKKYGNPSISSTCLLLESLAKLTNQQEQGTGVSALYSSAAAMLLADIERIVEEIRDLEGDRNLLDNWTEEFESSAVPLNYLVSEIEPIIRNSIQGISPEELAEYSAGRVLNPADTSARIEG